MKKFGYSKVEKLKQKKEISALFERGKWRSCGRIRMIILKNKTEDASSNNRVGISVSKRYFKKATDRNRIKRLLREAYRLNKNVFAEKFGNSNVVMIFWNSPEKPRDYSTVESELLSLCKSKK